MKGEQEHLIRLRHRSETGASLLADELRSVTEGSDFSITAPSIGNHTCVGCQVDGGALQAASTATLQAVSGGHIIVFVYRPKEDGSGDGNGSDDACNRRGCSPCCCKQYKLEDRSSAILTVPEEEALARIAKALGPVDINGMHGFSSDF